MTRLFPYFDGKSSRINDGDVYTFHDFCKTKFGKKCVDHYKSITTAGLHECPFGFATYATRSSLEHGSIYGSLVIRGLLVRKLKGRGVLKNQFFEDELARLVSILENNERSLATEKSMNSQESDLVRGVFHEIRRLSRDLDEAGTFFQLLNHNEDEANTFVIDNILQTIKLISIRVDSYELLKNPETVTSGKQPNIKVYKKFDKSRYILNSKSKQRGIHINFNNESYFAIDGYEIFDLLPYIILDNAVKYSPASTPVEVTFDDRHQSVVISSLGPVLEADEHSRLFERGFRGRNCLAIQGSGLGLNLLKQICDLHNIKVTANVKNEVQKTISGIPYAPFELKLEFKSLTLIST